MIKIDIYNVITFKHQVQTMCYKTKINPDKTKGNFLKNILKFNGNYRKIKNK